MASAGPSDGGRSSPLGSAFPVGHHGAGSACGVSLTELEVPAIWSVFGALMPGRSASSATRIEDGLVVDIAAASMTARLVPLGPKEWLALVGAENEPSPSVFGATFQGTPRLFDLTHARTVIRLRGDSVLEVLEKGCPLDLVSVEAHRGASTVLGPFSVVLIVGEGPAGEREVDVVFNRSYARSGWEWLVRASLEFSCEVRPSQGWSL